MRMCMCICINICSINFEEFQVVVYYLISLKTISAIHTHIYAYIAS